MAIIDRIKYDGDPSGVPWIIYKCPSEQFVLGSQLIVNQSQEALFFKGGEALDLFGPGTYTLKTGNLPLLNKIVNFPFGGKTPFAAEIYYINKTLNLNMKWGTSSPIPMEDPKYGLILNIGAHGQYGVSIVDSRLFVTKIIGALPNGTTITPVVILKYFNGLINSTIKTAIASYMMRKKISFLEVTQYLSELSATFKEALVDEFDSFGIELVDFYCESIAPRREEYEKLRGYKEELALGSAFYQQRRSLDIMEKLAENSSAGSMANAGIGVGMGVGVVGQIGNAFANIGQSLTSTNNSVQITCPKCGMQNNSGMKFCGGCGSKFSTTIICSHCGNEVPEGMKFCGECGKPIGAKYCPACGFENKPEMKFCGNCGAKL